jgi:hypothetical protein
MVVYPRLPSSFNFESTLFVGAAASTSNALEFTRRRSTLVVQRSWPNILGHIVLLCMRRDDIFHTFAPCSCRLSPCSATQKGE